MAAFVAFVAVLVPLWLGPAVAPFARLLGGEPEHRCACAMLPGRCGCAECERLEQARQLARVVHRSSTLRASCDDDGTTTAAAPLVGVLGAPFVVRETPFRIASSVPAMPPWHPFEGDGPPTPPPRSVAL